VRTGGRSGVGDVLRPGFSHARFSHGRRFLRRMVMKTSDPSTSPRSGVAETAVRHQVI
jgi:hypothetical protein